MSLKNRGGFIAMVLAVLGVVLYVTLFSSILTGLETIRSYANISTFVALETVIKISPTILLLLGIFGGAFVYWKGYKSVAAKGGDPGGLLRMVLGVLVIILFISLFYTILTSFYSLHGFENASEYTAFQTVVTILPTILFLMGIFAGSATAAGGYRARKKSRSAISIR